MSSRWHTDGGCYHLHTNDYTILRHHAFVRKQLVEELQTLLVTVEAQIHHIKRLIDHNLPLSQDYHDSKHLQELLHQIVQQIAGIRRQHRAVMYEDRDHHELQFIYQRRLSSQHWKPYQKPTCTRSCPPPRDRQYTARYLLPYEYVQLRGAWSPTFEPDSD